MKYREIYKALERRWKVSPGFRFSDFSGWRNPKGTYIDRTRLLWIVVEDRVSKQRIWLTHDAGVLKISCTKIDEHGKNHGKTQHVICSTQADMVREFEKLFVIHEAAA